MGRWQYGLFKRVLQNKDSNRVRGVLKNVVIQIVPYGGGSENRGCYKHSRFWWQWHRGEQTMCLDNDVKFLSATPAQEADHHLIANTWTPAKKPVATQQMWVA